jgi:hypothetical protein
MDKLNSNKEVNNFNLILKKAIKLLVSKGKDYNNNIERNQYFPFGSTSYVTMLYIKTLRLVSLERGKLNKKAHIYESTLDTCYDLLNYLIMFIDYLESKNEK